MKGQVTGADSFVKTLHQREVESQMYLKNVYPVIPLLKEMPKASSTITCTMYKSKER